MASNKRKVGFEICFKHGRKKSCSECRGQKKRELKQIAEILKRQKIRAAIQNALSGGIVILYGQHNTSLSSANQNSSQGGARRLYDPRQFVPPGGAGIS